MAGILTVGKIEEGYIAQNCCTLVEGFFGENLIWQKFELAGKLRYAPRIVAP